MAGFISRWTQIRGRNHYGPRAPGFGPFFSSLTVSASRFTYSLARKLMATGDCPFSGTWWWAARLVVLGPLGCSPEYALLETVSDSGDAGSAAVAVGTGGNPAVGGAAAGGTEYGGTGSGGLAGGSAGCGGAPTACPGPCTHGFQPVLLARNGCPVCECAPPSECSSSADCQNGEVCYAGRHCREGCSEPSCCFGNQCSPAGCSPNANSCLEQGCVGGAECLAACDATSCECDGSSWICANTTGGAPIASCPQACSVP